MEKVTVGLVPAPELPEVIARRLVDSLPKLFTHFFDSEVEWHVEVIVDSVAGAAESVEEIINEAHRLKNLHDWTYAICLTDLPIFSGKSIVLADANPAEGTAQISLPAFGAFPMKKRVCRTIIQMIAELYYGKFEDDSIKMAQRGIGPLARHRQRRLQALLMKPFSFSPIRRTEAPAEMECISVRFLIAPKVNGQLRLLFGMTYANRPWTILPSLKNVVALAFATGAYGLIFTTLWQLSASYNVYRFIGLNLAAITSMVLWILLSHNLWETPHGTNNPRVRRLYNSTTISTLIISVLIYYAVLFVLFLIAVTVFVPPSLYGDATGLEDGVGILSFLRLAWLVTSVATLAGAIGAGMENGDRVRNVTYGYRQARRYEDIEARQEKNDSKDS